MSDRSFMKWEDVNMRPVEEDDIEFLQELVQHQDVRDTIGRAPLPVNRKQEADWFEKMNENDEEVHFLIEYQGESAGECSLIGINEDFRRAEIGISIHPDFQNKGIGSRAVKMIVRYGFDTLNLHRIKGRYIEGNEASRRILEKSNLQEEGREREYKFVNGEWLDVISMGILEHEFYD